MARRGTPHEREIARAKLAKGPDVAAEPAVAPTPAWWVTSTRPTASAGTARFVRFVDPSGNVIEVRFGTVNVDYGPFRTE